jgi:hypothetical protein
LGRGFKYLGNTKIPNFDCVLSCKENILSLDIPMYNPSRVHIFEGEADLDEPVENFELCEDLPWLVDLPLDVVAEVANFTVLHDDDKQIGVKKAFFELYDVGVIQIF